MAGNGCPPPGVGRGRQPWLRWGRGLGLWGTRGQVGSHGGVVAAGGSPQDSGRTGNPRTPCGALSPTPALGLDWTRSPAAARLSTQWS